MSEKFRYKGVKPYLEEDKHLFYGRNLEIEQVFKLIYLEKFVVIYSKPGVGKTSIINAGLIPCIKQKNNSLIYSISFKNYVESSFENPVKLIIKELVKEKFENNYLDKIIDDDNDSIWIKLKKIQAQNKDIQQIIFFFDQFENLFSFPQNLIDEFKEQLSTALYSQIPEEYKDTVQQKVLNNTDFLTNDGFKLLYKPLNIKIVIGIRTDKLSFLNKLNDTVPGILQNCYELPSLSEEAAKEAITKPAEFEPKYITQNDFATKKFTYGENLVSEIISSLTNNNQKQIETFQLQIICENIERIVHDKKLDIVDREHIEDVKSLFKNYYENLINEIESEEQRKHAKILIEDELILEEEERRLAVYEGVIINKFKIHKSTLDTLVQNQLLKFEINNKNEKFYEISHDALVTPILKSKSKRIEVQIRSEEEYKQQIKLKELADKEHQKIIRTRKIASIIAFALLITILLAIYGKYQQIKSTESAANAQSNLLASFAFQELQKDPTLSLRLAQESYFTDKFNSNAYSALINAFYKTNIFYNILGEVEGYVESATISNDGTKILFISNDDLTSKFKVILTDIYGKTKFELKHIDNISTAVFSNDNQYILTACWDSTARIWDINGNKIQSFDEHKSILNSASFSDDGKMVVTAGMDNKAIVWNIDGTKITELIGHQLYVRSAEFSHDNKYVVTAAEDNSARIWDLTGKQISICIVEEEKYFFNTMILNAKFTHNDNNILLVSNAFVNTNHTARLFDFSGNEVYTYRGHTDWVNYVDITEDDKNVVTTSKDNDVIIWSKTGKILYTLKGHKASVFTAKFIENGTKLITVSFDGTIREWTLPVEPSIFSDESEISYATFSPSGIYIAGVFGSVVKISDLLGENILTLDKDTVKINTANISFDYKNIIVSSDDFSAKIYDFDGKLVNILSKHTDKVNTAVFSPDNNLYLTASDDFTAKLWNLKGEIIAEFKHNDKVNTAFFSSTGNLIITSSNDSTAKLWNLKGTLIQTFKGHTSAVTSASISPDEKYVITTGNDATARLYDINANLMYIFKGYESIVNSAEFSPDGKYIVTSCNDKTARLWDLNGHEIMIFKHDGYVKNASFSPNGKYILSVFYDDNYVLKTKLWLVDSDEICKHLDELRRFGNVWNLDENTKKQYNISF